MTADKLTRPNIEAIKEHPCYPQATYMPELIAYIRELEAALRERETHPCGVCGKPCDCPPDHTGDEKWCQCPDPKVEAERERCGKVIRDWFFTDDRDPENLLAAIRAGGKP
jgi:hypothetical protein